MWILYLIPDNILSAIINSLLIIGGLGLCIIWVFPLPYRITLNILFTILFSLGLWCKSSYTIETQWRESMKIAEEKIRIAEAKSKIVTEVVVTKYIEKVKIVKEKTHDIRKAAKQKITKKSNNACKLSNAFVWVHDSASKNEVSGTSGRSDETPSGIELSKATDTIIDNYGKYYEVSEQLKSLQDWVKDQKKVFDE